MKEEIMMVITIISIMAAVFFARQWFDATRPLVETLEVHKIEKGFEDMNKPTLSF
jgi:C4-dicarboxylate transporter